MNFNLVLKTYANMRQMSPDDHALLQTLRSLSDTDRERLIEHLSDKPQKKSSKKSAGKSRRASGMAAQLNKSLQQQRKATSDNSDDEFPDLLGGHEPCTFDLYGQQCGAAADANVHHMETVADYHEFQPAEQAAGASGD